MSPLTKPKSRLASEIRQSKPFPSLGAEAYLNLVRTSEALTDQVSRTCKAAGLSQPQYNVLRILRGAGRDGLLCGEVAERMVSRLPDISRLLDRLHRSGLIEKKTDPNDGRAVRIVLARKGSRALDSLDRPLKELLPNLFATLSESETKTLIRLLERIRP